MKRREWSVLWFTSLLLVVVLWASGWTSPWFTPDTSEYRDVLPYPEYYFAQRIPLYGWIMAGAGWFGTSAIIWLHVVMHVVAAMSLYWGTRAVGMGRAAATALFLSALLSQTFFIFGRGVHPESLAVSAALIAIAATVRSTADPHWKRFVVLAGLAAGTSYLLRPTFLPLIFTLVLLHVIVARLRSARVAAVRAISLLAAAAIPFLAYSTDRMRHTGHFNVVSFGGYNMSGMAGLMLSQAIVDRFPAAERPLAAQILGVRERAEAEGRVAPTPLNSAGERSFLSAAAGYFDIYARTYEDLLHYEIARLRLPDETWVAFDDRLQRFAFLTISLAPDRHVAWIVGASSRLVGRMLVTNAPFLVASGVLLIMLLVVSRDPSRIQRLRGSPDTLLLVAIVAIYLLSAAPMAVLVTFPASRYIDTSAVLLPALPLYASFRLIAAWRQDSQTAPTPSPETRL